MIRVNLFRFPLSWTNLQMEPMTGSSPVLKNVHLLVLLLSFAMNINGEYFERNMSNYIQMNMNIPICTRIGVDGLSSSHPHTQSGLMSPQISLAPFDSILAPRTLGDGQRKLGGGGSRYKYFFPSENRENSFENQSVMKGEE